MTDGPQPMNQPHPSSPFQRRLERLEALLVEKGFPYMDALREGTDADTVREIAERNNWHPTEELLTFFCWHNGTTGPDSPLPGLGRFNSIEAAERVARDPRWGPKNLWTQGFLPLGRGPVAYGIDCRFPFMDYSPVVWMDADMAEPRLHRAALADMVNRWITGIELGEWVITDYGTIQYRPTATRNTPGITYHLSEPPGATASPTR